MNQRYPKVALRAGHRCEYCRAPEAVFNFPFEVEHIIPVSRGGADAEVNWALACRSCNLRKAAHVNGIDPESQTIVRLFHPREDRWKEHFRADAESGEIHCDWSGNSYSIEYEQRGTTISTTTLDMQGIYERQLSGM